MELEERLKRLAKFAKINTKINRTKTRIHIFKNIRSNLSINQTKFMERH